jgi:acetyl-CoA carboxylase biotin carboxyl carrier protein
MANPCPNSDEFLDFRRIRRLARLMNQEDLSEIDLQQADCRIRLRRGVAPAGGTAIVQAAAPTASTTGASPPAPAAPVDEAHIAAVTSPMVGTFYSASNPESPPFVKVGDHVGPDTIVCIVEAMKVFNEIPAGVSGRVIAVLVENGEPVEFGQPLFKVDTRS